MANERESGTNFIRPITALLNVNRVTGSERAVLDLLLDGLSNKEIAERLFIETVSVKAHITSLYRKLNVSTRAQCIVKIAKLGHYEHKRPEPKGLPTGAIN